MRTKPAPRPDTADVVRELARQRKANDELRHELAETRDALRAIRAGEVDALVVQAGDVQQVFTLESAYELYRAFVENMSDGAAAVTIDGVILYANHRFAELIDAPAAQIVGESLFPLLGDAHRGCIALLLDSERQEPRETELVLAHRGGRTVALRISITALSDGTYCLTVGDMTAHRQAADEIRALNASLEARVRDRTSRLEAANADLESFSYSVSHDLRAPLRAIAGYSAILAEDYRDRLDDEARRILGILKSESERMGQLIDAVLAFSRLGGQAIAATTVDMAELAQSAFDEAIRTAGPRRVHLIRHQLPPARGEPAMLRQVWVNLIANAVKYTAGRNDAVIEVGGSASAEQAHYFIKDNGVGFDMAYADKLFGIFQRLHGEEEFPGHGVGLSVVKRVIGRHGGRVWADAQPDHGATFHFTLPRESSFEAIL